MKKQEKKNKTTLKDKFMNLIKKCKNNFKKSISFINKKNNFNTMEVVVLMIITSIFGMFVGGVLMYRKGALNTGLKKELNEFVSTYTEILNEYYKDVSEEGLLEAGISGMVDYLGDPYSVYMDEETSNEFLEKVNGEYVGIGAEIAQYEDKKLEVQNAYTDGPAYKSGIRNGDIITKVDGKDVTKMELSEITSLVKGKEGTNVKITILRDKKEKTFDVKRGSIDITSVTSEVIEYNDKKVGYMIIDIFALNTGKQFEKELKSLEKKKIDSLIIDVRGNSGGYLTTVTDIISLFLEKGEIIYQLKTKDKIEKIKDKTEEKRDYPIAILVNSGSASASEVLTSALMEKHEAYVVGTVTYGKGKVQKTQGLSNGASIKYTFQEWLTSNGKSIDEVGITPNHIVEYKASDDSNKYDSQLTEALNLVTKEG